jgi:hypothetical protein
MYEIYKMIALSTHEVDGYFYWKEGEIVDMSYDEYTYTIHEYSERYKFLAIRGEFLGDVFEDFMHLADWRDKQINSILDE